MLDRIGRIVEAARKREVQSVADIAKQTGVSADVLEALERGEAGITTTQLDAVADALSLDPGALLLGREVARPVASVFLRHQGAQDFDDRDAPVLDEALEQGREIVRLGDLLGRSPLALQRDLFPQHAAPTDRPESPAQDGYRTAQTVRRWRPGPIAPLGDMRALIEDEFGIAVLVGEFVSSKVTAASIRAGNAGAIVLNANDPLRSVNPLLTRVHLAHELCHVLLDPSEGGLHIVLDVVNDRQAHAAEQRARAFAAELLLPTEGLTELIGPPLGHNDMQRALDMVQLARSHFGTPHEIAANHLCNRGYVDRRLREWLTKAKSSYVGTAPSTSLPAPGARSTFLSRTVEVAHRETVVTDGEARAILGLDRIAPLPWDALEP